MSKVLLAGGSGLIGSDLISFLAKQGYSCHILTRGQTNKSANRYHWDPVKNNIDLAAFDGVSYVINLAGKNIIKGRWTKSRKTKLRSSRIDSTLFLVNKIKENQIKIKHFISASAIGFYGDRKDELLTESSEKGTGFLSDLCDDWETAAKGISGYAECSVVRIGLYLSESGGIYSSLSKLARFRMASAFGSGNQFVNYTHHDELGLLILNLINENYESGTYNAVGKTAVTLNDFISAIAEMQGRKKSFLNIPSWLLKLTLGEASTTLLNSTRVESEKLKELEFYQFNEISEAIITLK